MNSARHVLFALIASTASANACSACGLTDWLYGRQPAYAVTPAIPITMGEPVSPYAAGYAPSAGFNPYTAGYTPLLTPARSSNMLPLAGQSIGTQSPYAVQRPAYGAVPLNNPSVYTGLPVMSGYRGSASAGTSIYGSGNLYPNNSPGYTANMGSTTTLPIQSNYPTPIRSGLARFFDSFLGTGYRSSYYNAPITYYRPATTFDPVTGTTVTVQQPCVSTVQQLQRTPYTTFQPATIGGGAIGGGIDQCGGVSSCDPISGSMYGVSPIPSTMSPGVMSPGVMSFDSMAPSNGFAGAGDSQPIAMPSLPTGSMPSAMSSPPSFSDVSPNDSTPNYSGRPTYLEPAPISPSANFRPLTGSSLPSVGTGDSYDAGSYGSPPSYRQEFQSDREPIAAPEIRAARPAFSATENTDSRSSNDAYDQERQAYLEGYEAGRAATQEESDERAESSYSPNVAPEKFPPDYEASTDTDSGNSSGSEFNDNGSDGGLNGNGGLNPPANSRPSTQETHQRSRFEIERDQRDLRELTTGVPRSSGDNRYVNRGVESAPRVQPIPAPEDYRNPFEAAPRVSAPDLLPALPRPSVQFRPNVDRASGYSGGQRLSVPVRGASIQGEQDRVATRSSQEGRQVGLRQVPVARVTPTQPTAFEAPPQSPAANAWQSKLRQQSKDSGWYAK